MSELATAAQEVTSEMIEVVFVVFLNQRYTSDVPAAAAREHGVRLAMVTLPESKRVLVLLPRRWEERSFA